MSFSGWAAAGASGGAAVGGAGGAAAGGAAMGAQADTRLITASAKPNRKRDFRVRMGHSSLSYSMWGKKLNGHSLAT
ncbi:MAG TPA: hypothetical protein EYP04_06795 [Anaerolineae bacterium]|nr:hypothetical protein [Anaerolineae bacterium]